MLSAHARSQLEVTGAKSADCGPSEAIDERVGNGGGSKILIVDDDAEFLDAYARILNQLPSRPEVRPATSATRALALLDAEPFALLIADLRMPKIDGFQVLMAARRRFPTLKTVALTGMGDQQYRARAYASGIDLYTEKPTTPAEIRLFGECIETLLAQGMSDGGFRGIQSKSLMDLVQIECLSQNSSVLRITRGSIEGRVWIQCGSVVDAEVNDLRGEEAFKHIFGWKTGHFEFLPPDPLRERTIYAGYESLLLDSAQSFDEATALGGEAHVDGAGLPKALQPLANVRGVEALLLVSGPGRCDSWGFESPEEFAGWTHRTLLAFRDLGGLLDAGPLRAVEAAGPVRGVVLLADGDRELMAGLDRKLSARTLRSASHELATHLQKE
jgi:CheY-like chemotaxis protein